VPSQMPLLGPTTMFSRRPTTGQSVVALVSHSPIGIRASISRQLQRVRVSLRQIRTAAVQNTVPYGTEFLSIQLLFSHLHGAVQKYSGEGA